MYTYPPRQFTSSIVLAAGFANQLALATPGASQTLRIVKLSARLSRAANSIVQIDWTDSIGGSAGFFVVSNLGTAGGAGTLRGSDSWSQHDFPEPGYQLPVNAGLRMYLNASAAGDTLVWSVLYYVDTVS